MIRMLLVDNHVVVAQGIKYVLENNSSMVVDILTDSRYVLTRTKEMEYDIVLIDMFMNYLNGFELSKQILHDDPSKKILIFTEKDIALHFNVLVETGVCGFISKEDSSATVVNAVECALRGETVIPTKLFKQLRRTEASALLETCEGMRDITLTEREQMVLLSISEGLTNQQIADRILVSQRAVEYTITEIFKKLNVKSRAEAWTKANNYSLITLQQYPEYTTV
ncbi:response regulator [Pontibacillus salicampi]|uniref:Response regulator n=1 Tax=Pontibacillus salicampi TaxID=1449801 RepID=A0ABV6LMU4_9BACI